LRHQSIRSRVVEKQKKAEEPKFGELIFKKKTRSPEKAHSKTFENSENKLIEVSGFDIFDAGENHMNIEVNDDGKG